MNIRLQRLYNDHEEIKDLPRLTAGRVQFVPEGDPPTRYVVTYDIKGAVKRPDGKIGSPRCATILAANMVINSSVWKTEPSNNESLSQKPTHSKRHNPISQGTRPRIAAACLKPRPTVIQIAPSYSLRHHL